MNDPLVFWEPTMGAMDAIIRCLPRETQQMIFKRLQLLAKDQVECGMETASYYSRALSGELAPTQSKPQPKLALVK